MNRDLFLAILSLDSYNRGYGEGITDLPETGSLGNARLLAATTEQQEGWEAAGFYAIAYDVSGVAGFADGERVIAYRGSDYQDTNGAILRSNDLWQGWTVGAGFPGGGQAGLALEFYTAVTGQSPYNTPGTVTLTGHSLGGALAGFVSALSGNQALLFDHLPFGVSAYLQSLVVTGTVGAVQPGLPSAYHVENDVAALTRAGGLSLVAAANDNFYLARAAA